eukprot:207183-Chlamydomonas_euryale.AAC.2
MTASVRARTRRRLGGEAGSTQAALRSCLGANAGQKSGSAAAPGDWPARTTAQSEHITHLYYWRSIHQVWRCSSACSKEASACGEHGHAHVWISAYSDLIPQTSVFGQALAFSHLRGPCVSQENRLALVVAKAACKLKGCGPLLQDGKSAGEGRGSRRQVLVLHCRTQRAGSCRCWTAAL